MKRAVLVFAALWCLIGTIPALAFVPRTGNVVVVGVPIQDDVYISGGTVQVASAVDGDVVVVGGTVTLTAPVTGGIVAAGGTVTVGGPIGRSLRAAGGALTVAGHITSDAVLAGGSVDVSQGAEVGRDLAAAGGTLVVSGSVGRNAFLSGGRILISGTIQGDAEVQANQLVLLPTARIKGHLRYAADAEAQIQTGAEVSGGAERLVAPFALRPGRAMDWVPFRRAGRVLEALWLLAFGLVAAVLAPRGVPRVVERIREGLGPSLLTGFVLLVVVPVVAAVLFATIVGVPLAVVALLLYLATLYPGLIFTAVWLGEWIVRGWRRSLTQTPSPYLTLPLGTLGLVLLFSIPWAGWVIRALALLVGFGALWGTVWETRGSAQLTVRSF